MRSRLRMASLLTALAAALVAAGCGSDTEEQGQPPAELKVPPADGPNIIVIQTDDQTVRDLRVMPTVRREIGATGVSFEKSYVAFPLCCPSRVSLLTGQYAHNHGVVANNGPNGGYEAFDDSDSLPVALSSAGYRTAMVGKYLNGYHGPDVPDGWTDWAAKDGGRLFDFKLNINGETRRFGTDPEDYSSDVTTDFAVKFIERQERRGGAYFMWASYYAPHTEGLPGEAPADPRPAPRHEGEFADEELPRPPSFDERDIDDKPSAIAELPRPRGEILAGLEKRYRSRLEALQAVDEGVGEIIAALRRTGQLADTYVLYTSDNGYLFGEHRISRKTALYEESVRVPLLMRGPGLPKGEVREQLVSNIDLAPTFLEIADARPLAPIDGQSLLPVAESASARQGRELLYENDRSVALRVDRHVYIEHETGGGEVETELYDLQRDPFQLESLHDEPGLTGLRRKLAARLDELRDCAGAECRSGSG